MTEYWTGVLAGVPAVLWSILGLVLIPSLVTLIVLVSVFALVNRKTGGKFTLHMPFSIKLEVDVPKDTHTGDLKGNN